MAMEREYRLMWRAIKICDVMGGTNTLHDPRQKLSKVQLFCRIACASIYFGFMSLLVFNAYKFRMNPLLLILAGSMFVIFLTIGTSITSLYTRKEDYMIVLNWCKKVIEAEGPLFVKARKTCIQLVKFNLVLCYGLGFMSALFPAIMGLFLTPGEFTTPLPFVLPYLDPKTWTAFIPNTFLQAAAWFVWDTLGGVIFPIFGIHYFSTIAYIDDLVEKIQALGRDILENERQKKKETQKSRMVKKYKGNPSVGNASTSNKNKDFAESIKEIVEKYCDAVEMFNIIGDNIKYNMLFMEYLSFANIFIGGIIILVEKEHYSLGISSLVTAGFFYPLCYVNEKIIDKLMEVSEALYDLPWWHLSIKDRRELLLALNCGFVTGGFTAADMHDLTVEKFSAVVQAGYSNVLVLKDLIVTFT